MFDYTVHYRADVNFGDKSQIKHADAQPLSIWTLEIGVNDLVRDRALYCLTIELVSYYQGHNSGKLSRDYETDDHQPFDQWWGRGEVLPKLVKAEV